MGIVLSKELKHSLVSVSRTNDRVMSIKLGVGKTLVNVIYYVHTPQVGCAEEEKETSWRYGSRAQRSTRMRKIVGGHLNGHEGRWVQ